MNIEEQIEHDIRFYKEQLINIKSMMDYDTGNDLENSKNLNDLHNEIDNLLKSSEEKLLQLKKEKLLNILESDYEYDNTINNQHSIIDTSNTIESSDLSDTLQLIYAPYDKGYGYPEYHTAIVIGEEDIENFRIIYTHPCYSDMVYCKNFLSNECFDEKQCKFSHGKIISSHFLKEVPFEDFDFIKNKKCLVKLSEDNLWEKAKIVDIMDDIVEVCIIKKSTNESLLVPKNHIWFYTDKNNDKEEDKLVIDSAPNLTQEELNDVISGSDKQTEIIDDSTSCFASKMMKKMGYIPGMGLGRMLQGRIEPIHIYKAPQGVSLDSFMELKATGLLPNLTEKSQNITNNETSTIKDQVTGKSSKKNKIFKTLNNLTKLKCASKSINTQFKNVSKRRLDKQSTNLNLQAYQVSEDIKDYANEIQIIKQSIKRNANDKRYVEKLKKKLSYAEHILNEMQNDEIEIKSKLDKEILKKKMASFK